MEDEIAGPSVLVCHRTSSGDFAITLSARDASVAGVPMLDHGVVFVTAGELLATSVRFGEQPLPVDKQEMNRVRDYRLR